MSAQHAGRAVVAAPTGMQSFSVRLLDWFAREGRHDLPWQHPRSAYRVWLSEIMLQQTRVQTVIPYFARFVAALPDLPALARAGSDEVMALWSGLGYYARARHLHAAAKQCVAHHGGELPDDFDALLALPGIGRSTAGAILSQAHGLKFPILDGNVRRVLARWRGIEGWPGAAAIERELWQLAQSLLPDEHLPDYAQGLMDLGATVCTRADPDCARCPLRADCVALRSLRTAELPASRPGKPLPRRACVMLVAVDGEGRVLLQKREAPGVWNGLWSLPEAPDAAVLDVFIRQHLHAPNAARALPAFEHVFSHYRLAIQPQRRDGVAPRPRVAESGPELRWAAPGEWPGIGLPAPVRKLLLSSLRAESPLSAKEFP